MKYLGAYMLAVMGGNESPDAAAVKKILDSAGVEFEAATLDKVISELSGKNVFDVISEGKEKMSAVPAGGAPAAAGGAAGGDDKPAEEEKKEESEEEEEEDMDFDLFD